MDEALEKYQKAMSRRRKIRQQALAILRRATAAGIPEKYQRLKQDSLEPLLCEDYYGGKEGVKKVADRIFKDPMSLFDKPFFVIDGGDMYDRKTASYALLFRMISCDKVGLQESATTLSRSFQTFTTDGIGRNDYLISLLNPSVLLVQDFHAGLLKSENMNGGDFFDDLFEKRDNSGKTTIITFQTPIPGEGIVGQNGLLADMRYGQYLSMLSKADKNPKEQIFRIRLNINE
tara:strand:+ start:18980 stop:19675 length:696 start_codon:yes stop_codon:yes gene_type:complete